MTISPGDSCDAAVVTRCLVRADEEVNRCPFRVYRAAADPRQRLPAALHRELKQVNVGQLSMEIALRGDKDLHLRGPDCLLICTGVKEGGHATPRHGWTSRRPPQMSIGTLSIFVGLTAQDNRIRCH